MALSMARISGLKAGEHVTVEEQDKTGYTVDPKAVSPGTFNTAEQNKTGYETNILLPTGLDLVRYDAAAITDDYFEAKDLGRLYYGIMLYAYQAKITFKISYNNVVWSNDIYLQKNHILSFDVKVRYWRAKRTDAGVGAYALIYSQGKV